METLAVGDSMKLAEMCGPVLSGRMDAISLREELSREAADGGTVVLDFAGVEAVSPSFADEIFGRFIDEVGEDHVRFENLHGDLDEIVRVVRRSRRATH